MSSNSTPLNSKLEEHYAWLEGALQQGTCCDATTEETRYLPAPILRDRFTERGGIHLRQLLETLGLPGQYAQQIVAEYPAVFATLLDKRVQKGHYIGHFIEHGLNDHRLPQTSPDQFPKSEDIFGPFNKAQWTYCVKPLTPNFRVFEPPRILPFTRQGEPLGRGYSATIHKIDVPKHYDNLGPGCKVIKTYAPQNAEKEHRVEINALENLGACPAIIGLRGHFRQGEAFHTILEFANGGTIEQIFQTHSEPRTPEDILCFYSRLLELSTALMTINNRQTLEQGPGHGVEYGWHQDIKPDNILVVIDDSLAYGCRFKICDFGTSHFKTWQHLTAPPLDSDSRGSRTYGAPECYRSDRYVHRMSLFVEPKVDIWSLGAILCEAVVWVVLGRKGLEKFRAKRREAIKLIAEFRDQDCFHDGQDRLAVVDHMLDEVRRCLGDKDPITHLIIDDLLPLMLTPVEGRFDARQLHEWGKRIVAKAKQNVESLGLESSTSGTHIPMSSPTPPPPGFPHASRPEIRNAGALHGAVSHKSPEIPSSTPPYTSPPNSTSGLPISGQHGRAMNDSVGNTPSPRDETGAFRSPSVTTRSDLDHRTFYARASGAVPTFSASPDSYGQARSAHEHWTRNLPKVDPAASQLAPTNASGQQDEAYLPAGEHSKPRPQQNTFSATRYPFVNPVIGINQGFSRQAPQGQGSYHSHPSAISSPRLAAEAMSTPNRWIPSESQHLSSGISTSHQFETPSSQWSSDRAQGALPNGCLNDRITISSNERAASNHAGGSISKATYHRDLVTTRPESSNIMNSMTQHWTDPAAASQYHTDTQVPLHRGGSRGSPLSPKESAEQHNLEYLSVDGLLEWHSSAQQNKRRSIRKERHSQWSDLVNGLRGRDHIFLIDDSSSMKDHWQHATKLFRALAAFIKYHGLDDNGMDLHFAISEVEKVGEKHVTPLTGVLETVNPSSHDCAFTNRLDSILSKYRQKLASRPSVRGLQIYALTTGVWRSRSDAESLIQDLVGDLIRYTQPNNVGIQFIRFGENRDAIARLDRYDRLGKTNPAVLRDIVDVEPYDGGNVLKMLLASTDKTYDNDRPRVEQFHSTYNEDSRFG